MSERYVRLTREQAQRLIGHVEARISRYRALNRPSQGREASAHIKAEIEADMRLIAALNEAKE